MSAPSPAIDEARILEALAGVPDPDLGRDVVALGYVQKIRLCEGLVTVDLKSSVPGSAAADALRAAVRKAIADLPGVTQAVVNITAQVRKTTPKSAVLTEVRNVIAVASGKGGVGKSTVAANLACALQRMGATVGLMDCDVYGPSQAMMFGLAGSPTQDARGMINPPEQYGIRIMSMGLLADERTPVIWRGPRVHSLLVTFLSQVNWGSLDYLVLDLPPGTGDAQLSLCQNAPLSGAVIVSTPQDVSLLDARKGLRMFREVSVPVLGVVENMSGFVCEECGHNHAIFGKGGAKRLCTENNVPFLGEVPIDPEVVVGGDEGTPIVMRKPDGPAAVALTGIARRIVAQLSEISFKTPEIPSLKL